MGLRRLVDPLLAAVLLGAGAYALWRLPPQESGFVAPRPVDLMFLALTSVPLAWRRKAPLPVFAVVLVSTWLWLGLWYGDAAQPPFEPAVALWLATFSAAVAARGRVAWFVAMTLASFLVATDVPALIDGRPLGNVLPAWVLFALAFLMGRELARRKDQMSALRERNRRLRVEHEEGARRVAAAERARIARELHDVVTHAVSGMVVQAAAEKRILPPTADSTRQVLDDIEVAGREAMVELRRLLGVLRKSDDAGELHPQPSLDDLHTLIESTRSSGLPVHLTVEGEARRLPSSVDLSAFRVVQEGLTNVRKHAGSVATEVTLRYRGDNVEIEVLNTAGIDVTSNGDPAYGLIGLRERVMLHDGTLQAGLRQDGCYRLLARLPYNGATG